MSDKLTTEEQLKEEVETILRAADPEAYERQDAFSALLAQEQALVEQVRTEAAVTSLLAASTPKKTKKDKAPKVAVELTLDGGYFYTDAGARPNPGFAGYGIHGCLYSLQPAKKGCGNSAVYVTEKGYVNKADVREEGAGGSEPEDLLDHPEAPQLRTKPVEVTPLRYVDGFGSLLAPLSNNAAEIIAVKEGLQAALQFDLKKVTILTDSEYTRKGANEYLPKWETNGWVKSDGSVLPNSAHWQDLAKVLACLKEKNVQTDIRWVRGHGSDVGNQTVDRYATMGVRLSRANQGQEVHAETVSSPAEGYWAGEDRHPFLHHKCTYFVSARAHNVAGEYYLGDHGKDDELLGKRQADTSYAYVLLKTPEPLLETVREKFISTARREDALAFALMGRVFDNTIAHDLEKFRGFALYRKHPQYLHLYHSGSGKDTTLEKESPNESPVLVELNPPRIAIRAIEAVNTLKGLLKSYQHDPQTELVATVLTARIYEPDAKGQPKLRAEFGPGFTTLKVQADYALHPTEPQRAQTELPLVLGVDLPERNALKRLEKFEPVITLVTWREAAAIRYATIVQTRDAVGIWAGYYANFKYLKALTPS